MNLTTDVNVPEEILNDLISGNLVIFAGAGISMGSPANLPSFVSLTERIIGHKVAKHEENRLDQVLGDAKRSGIHVNLEAANIISSPSSKPNSLHYELANLFSSANHIRIVTTNFDRHLTVALNQRFGDSFEIYNAPAIPLGSSFQGLVYLHGSIEKDPVNLVLTDEDFGRSYLTEGWATRFLKDMFTAYRVLFIGYSHDDTVMRYLSRGLPPGTKRFAFTDQDLNDNWKELGITPIGYKLTKDKDNWHQKLPDTVSEMARWTTMVGTDHAAKIQSILQSSAILAPNENDYLRDIIQREKYAEHFRRYASDITWLNWLDSNKFLDAFFEQSPLTAISRSLAYCIAEQYILQYSDEVFSTLKYRSQRLNAEFRLILLNRLSDNQFNDRFIFNRWLSFLLNDPTAVRDHADRFGQLLIRQKSVFSSDTALNLFEQITRPEIILEPSLSYLSTQNNNSLKKVQANIDIPVSAHTLRRMWSDYFKSILPSISIRILNITIQNLLRSNSLVISFTSNETPFDRMNFRRLSIADHAQNSDLRAINTLIDIARDSAEEIIRTSPKHIKIYIDQWINTDSLIVQRLGLYFLSLIEERYYRSSAKMRIIIKRGWLFDSRLKHEVYALIKTSYHHLSENSRKSFLRTASAGPSNGVHEPDVKAYMVYNLLSWVCTNEPGCNLAKIAKNSLQLLYPHFKPRDHPDFNRWIGPLSHESNISLTPDEIIKFTPKEVIEYLEKSSTDDDGFAYNSSDKIQGIISAVVESFLWSTILANCLKDGIPYHDELWEAILQGWQLSIFNDSQWEEIVSILEDNLINIARLHSLSQFLEKSVSRSSAALPSILLPRTNLISEYLAKQFEENSVINDVSDETDWYFASVSSPIGLITKYRLYAVSINAGIARQNNKNTNLGDNDKLFFEKKILNSTLVSDLAKTVITSQLVFLYSVDREWTVENVLPLLDWTKNASHARKSWSGYLGSGNLSRSTLSDILPLYEQTFGHIDDSTSDDRRMFSHHIAAIAIIGLNNFINIDWVWKFLLSTTKSVRELWTQELIIQINQFTPDALRSAWDSWLEKYITDRFSGRPVPLTEQEWHDMAVLACSIEPIFDEYINIMMNSDVPAIKDFPFYELEENNFFVNHAKSTADLISLLLKHEHDSGYHLVTIANIVTSLKGHVPNQTLQPICNKLATLGYTDAHNLLS